MAETAFTWEQSIRSESKRVALVGYALVALLVGCFGYWAATAPLSGAAVAHGAIAASSRNVLIQHLEGGILASSLVEEGDRVRVGQALTILDDTAARTQVNRFRKQLVSLLATAQRLTAERDGAAEFLFADTLAIVRNNDGLTNLVDEQRREFNARFERFRSERNILHQRVSTLQESLLGLEARERSADHRSR